MSNSAFSVTEGNDVDCNWPTKIAHRRPTAPDTIPASASTSPAAPSPTMYRKPSMT
jgi:hypothetical protein